MRALVISSIIAHCLGISTGLAQIPAFPGADGAAADVTGGRGGIVYHVTKLNSALDDPEKSDFGTLRYGLSSGNFPAGVPRTIVFDVGGVFDLGRGPLDFDPNWDANGNGWDSQSRLTIGGTNVNLLDKRLPGRASSLWEGASNPRGTITSFAMSPLPRATACGAGGNRNNPFPTRPL